MPILSSNAVTRLFSLISCTKLVVMAILLSNPCSSLSGFHRCPHSPLTPCFISHSHALGTRSRQILTPTPLAHTPTPPDSAQPTSNTHTLTQPYPELDSLFHTRLSPDSILFHSSSKQDSFNFSHNIPRTINQSAWVQQIRRINSQNIYFIDINDGSSPIDLQVVVHNEGNGFKDLDKIKNGDAISVVGTLDWRKGKPTERSRSSIDLYLYDNNPDHKLTVHDVELRQASPVVPNIEYTNQYLRKYPHLRLRNKRIAAIMRIRGLVVDFAHDFFRAKRFIYTDTPCLTTMNSEDLGELFTVNVPNSDTSETNTDNGSTKQEDRDKEQSTYLTVSGQLELESLCCSMGNVWKIGPTFRADKANTTRHTCEFWMIEAETIYATVEGMINMIQEFVRGVANHLIERHGEEVELLESYKKGYKEHLSSLASTTIKTIKYDETVKILKELRESDQNSRKYELEPIEWGDSISTSHERALVRHFGGMVAVTHYPESIKPFYMRVSDESECPEEGRLKHTVDNFDILAPYSLELAGGSMRECRYDILKRKMEERNMSGEEYKRYLELRMYGNMPHGGFGMGVERLVMLVTMTRNIRDVIPFPKTIKRNAVK